MAAAEGLCGGAEPTCAETASSSVAADKAACAKVGTKGFGSLDDPNACQGVIKSAAGASGSACTYTKNVCSDDMGCQPIQLTLSASVTAKRGQMVEQTTVIPAVQAKAGTNGSPKKTIMSRGTIVQ